MRRALPALLLLSACLPAASPDAGTAADAGAVAAGPRDCAPLAGGPWCVTWLPDAGELRALWGSADDDLWLAGDLGLPDAGPALLHRTGAGWTWVPAPCALAALSGTAADDVWGAGYGCVAHFAGAAWAADDAGFGAQAIWAAARGQPWVLAGGRVLRREDGGWRDLGLDGGEVFGLGGSGPADAWAVGGSWALGRGNCSTISHWDGAAWAPALDTCDGGNTGPVLTAVAATRPDRAWAVGIFHGADTSSPGAYFWNGQDWIRIGVGLSNPWSSGPPFIAPVSALAAAGEQAWAAGAGGVAELGGVLLPLNWERQVDSRAVWASPTTVWEAGTLDGRPQVGRLTR